MQSLVSSLGSFFARPARAANPGDLIRRAFKDGMTPQDARLALRTLINRTYPVAHWIVPPRDAADQSFRRYQIAAPGLHDLKAAVGPALEVLSNCPRGARNNALRAELRCALERSHLAEAHWVPRLHTAWQKGDRPTIALCTVILGEHHPEVAHLRDPDLIPAPCAPSTPDPLTGRLAKFPLLQAVLLEQDAGTLNAIACDRYQYDRLQDHLPVIPATVKAHLTRHSASLSAAIEDTRLARDSTRCMADATQRAEVESMLDTLTIRLTNARTYWTSVLAKAPSAPSRTLQDMACAWLGEDDPAVVPFRQTDLASTRAQDLPCGAIEWQTLTHGAGLAVLRHGEEKRISFEEEQVQAWDQVRPLAEDAYVVEAFPAPAPPASTRLQDPSVARLLEARRQRAAPFRAFVDDMLTGTR